MTPTPTPTPQTRSVWPSVTIDWAARSRSVSGRDVSAPSSALSAQVTVTGDQGSSVSFEADRPSGTAAVDQTYQANSGIKVTNTVTVTVAFFAQAGAAGSQVATAQASGLSIQNDGTLPTSVTNIQSAVASVSVAPGQSVNVGEQKYLSYAVTDASSRVLAVAPGSAFFSAVSGADKLSVSGEVGTGVAAGPAQVEATVDGVSSPPQTVTVVAPVRIALVANGAYAQTISLVQLLQAKGITPTQFNAVPDPATLQNFDVLMLWSSKDVPAAGIFGSADAAKAKAFLDTGRGVVLLGSAPAVLANGSDTQMFRGPGDTESTLGVAPWFAGVSQMQNQAWYYLEQLTARTGPGDFPLPSPLLPGTVVCQLADGDDEPTVPAGSAQNPTADVVVTGKDGSAAALAYEEPAVGSNQAGRLYFQWHPYAAAETSYTNGTLALLIAGTDWTARR